uniref:Uncharacterized protein n=1 Tax=Corvus moneduloides TaxID=1196302 RepID=A0A8C3DD26_CORMO
APQGHSQHSSGFSSELSPQSSSPSHFQARGLHRVLLHWNSSRGHVRTFSSSVPSMQSASASQRQRMGMQCPFLHWNWSNSQRGVQSFCRGRARDTVSRDSVALAAPPGPPAEAGVGMCPRAALDSLPQLWGSPCAGPRLGL